MKYQSLQPTISRFFRSKGIGCEAKRTCEVSYSPYSEKIGPDIMRCSLVGEIKDEQELDRDLSSSYWSDWNNLDKHFGGKVKEYQLKNDLPSSVPDDGKIKGWIAVIYGQLRYYRREVGLPDAWLIIQNYSKYNKELCKALSFLENHQKISSYVLEEFEGLGFVHIFYCDDSMKPNP